MTKSKSGKSRSRNSRTKMRTRKTAAKRVKPTATVVLRTRHACVGHLLTRKSQKIVRRLRTAGIVSASDRKQFDRLVPPAV